MWKWKWSHSKIFSWTWRCKKKSDYDKIPLFNACESGNEVIVKYLVEHGAYKIDEEGITPLFKAFESGNIVVVKYLVEHGADINQERNNLGGAKIRGETPLFKPCTREYKDIV